MSGRKLGLRVGALAVLAAGLVVAGAAMARTRSELHAATVSNDPVVPGALVKPIERYSGDEFFAFTRHLKYGGGGEHARPCREQPQCGTDSTRIQVDGIVGDDSLSAALLPPNGAIAIRALNRGPYTEAMYNMRPGAQYEHYFIMIPVPNSATATWRVEELTTTPGARAHRTVASGMMRECPRHAFQRGPRADFKTCDHGVKLQPASLGPVMQGGVPAWFGCVVGCCTADPPGGGQ